MKSGGRVALMVGATLVFTACAVSVAPPESSDPAPDTQSQAQVPATAEPDQSSSGAPVEAPRADPSEKASPRAGAAARRAAAAKAAAETTAQQDPFAERDGKQKVIYLTFDDGPWTPYTEEILAILREHKAKATFFVVGDMAQHRPDLVKRIHREGHALGNHTQGHPDLTKLTPDEVRAQISAPATSVGKHLGPCMRPPYGAINKEIRAISRDLGYTPVRWNVHVDDWEKPSAAKMVAEMKDATADGLNLLLHDGGGERSNTVAAVREIVPYWVKQGYQLQTLPICRKL
ncbi:MAG: polysaccharide deacetylase family protein [Actinomycetia bacterium]|nr:polysaccharide deacetylase family protein [Actinomycetes bacterium]